MELVRGYYFNEREHNFKLFFVVTSVNIVVSGREAERSFKMTTYKQFDVRYFDFAYNNERVRTFTDLSDAMEFMEWIVLCRANQMRFIALESVY